MTLMVAPAARAMSESWRCMSGGAIVDDQDRARASCDQIRRETGRLRIGTLGNICIDRKRRIEAVRAYSRIEECFNQACLSNA